MQTAKFDRSKQWTLEDYLMLGEMNTPCQLINGELIMSPSATPYHQNILGNLYDIFRTEATKTGAVVLFAPIDLYIDNKNVFQPDLVYISKENKNIITRRAIEGVPDSSSRSFLPPTFLQTGTPRRRSIRKSGSANIGLSIPQT